RRRCMREPPGERGRGCDCRAPPPCRQAPGLSFPSGAWERGSRSSASPNGPRQNPRAGGACSKRSFETCVPKRSLGTRGGAIYLPRRRTPAHEVRMNEWVLAEQTHAFIRSQPWEVAVLPFGATEPHNLHMPYGTDTFQVEVIGRLACERAYQSGARVVLLPALPFGVNTNYFKVPGALACSLTPTTLLAVITDLVDA